MPNPRVHRKGELVIGMGALEHKPALAHLMARVIVRWSTVETHIAMAFAAMIPDETEIVSEIYHTFFDQGMRRKVFLSVAKAKLPKPLIVETENFLNESRRVSEDRNKVAHSLWCYSPSVPECLCTIEQKFISQDFMGKMRRVVKDPTFPSTLTADNALGAALAAYNESDFTNMLSRMDALDRRGLRLAAKCATALFPLSDRAPD